MSSSEEYTPLAGGNVVVGNTKRPAVHRSEPPRFPDLRTSPETWDQAKPQLHESRGGRPLIVLIGWAGASPLQISPVVYFWQDQGCSVLRISPDMMQEYTPSSAVKKFDLFYQYIRTYVMPNRGFVVHAMSNLGATTLGHIMEIDAQKGRGLFSFCRGVIFDCGPSLPQDGGVLNIPRLTEDALVMTSARKHQPLAPIIDLFWTPLYLLLLLLYALCYRTAIKKSRDAVFANLTSGLADHRVMLMHSELDSYVQPEQVKTFHGCIAKTSKVSVCLTDVAHCASVVDAPELTHPALKKFLLRCEED
eukprot:TRINITY_DN3035_c1_g1_i1.p1 TRINITY_DN3035_c1_g1~~TRINITY_DN3035_c1_g1_i1.p1  ORF type:complete len:305 (+),score=13.95 TRINITY_DN3035_c1_g1_i1:85-999(+)